MVLSARSGEAERLIAQRLGAATFVVKPFEPAEIARRGGRSSGRHMKVGRSA
jgi:DNA-binding response OmpR family regulator